MSREDQLSWLARALDRGGFEPAKVDVLGHELVTLERAESKGGVTNLVQARFIGGLHVVDPVAAAATLVNGVGKGKAFGCGMLTLR